MTTQYPTVICKECGDNDTASYNDVTKNRMVNESLCFNCLFWIEWIEKDKLPEHKHKICRVASGNHYYADGIHENKNFLGMAGRRYKIKWLDDNTITETNNLWHQGEIPKHFKDRLPINAEILKN